MFNEYWLEPPTQTKWEYYAEIEMGNCKKEYLDKLSAIPHKDLINYVADLLSETALDKYDSAYNILSKLDLDDKHIFAYRDDEFGFQTELAREQDEAYADKLISDEEAYYD